MLMQEQHAAARTPQQHALQQQGVRWVVQQQYPAQAHGSAWAGQQQQQVQVLVPGQPAHMQQGGGAVGAAQGVGHVVLQQMPQDHVVQQHSQGVVQVFQLPQQLSPGQVVLGAQFQQWPQYNQEVLQPRQRPQQVQYVPVQAVAAGQVVLHQHSPQRQQWQGQQQVRQQHAAGYVLQQTGQPALQQVSPQMQQPQLMLTVPDMQVPVQQLPFNQAIQVLSRQQQVVVGPSGPGSGSSIVHAPHAGAAAQGAGVALGAGLAPGVLLVPAGAGMACWRANQAGSCNVCLLWLQGLPAVSTLCSPPGSCYPISCGSTANHLCGMVCELAALEAQRVGGDYLAGCNLYQLSMCCSFHQQHSFSGCAVDAQVVCHGLGCLCAQVIWPAALDRACVLRQYLCCSTTHPSCSAAGYHNMMALFTLPR